tara:strand:+ start:113 stop:259 length:147 start_codon:yes stop_codon:yes gene_type:complete
MGFLLTIFAILKSLYPAPIEKVEKDNFIALNVKNLKHCRTICMLLSLF